MNKQKVFRAIQQGFTLIELVIVIAILAIIASIAVPGYKSYVLKSRVPEGFTTLASTQYKVEQTFIDTGSYVCPTVADGKYYTYTCALTGTTGYTLTATGTGSLSGYKYTVDQDNVRITVSHPYGLPSSNCWSLKGGTCDVGG